MRAHGREAVWSIWVEDTLHSHPMFGRVDRKGKVRLSHSSLNPSLTHFVGRLG